MRRLTLFVAAVFLVLASACGSDSQETSSVDTPSAAAASATAAADLRLLPLSPAELGAPPVPAATKATAPSAVPYEPAVAPYASYGSDAAPGVFPRTIRHAMGETTLKSEPKRVVVLDTGELDAVFELGLTPVGTLDYTTTGLPPYLEEKLSGVRTVGTLAEPSLETIAALRPDLILSNKLRHEQIYDQLAAIAPTVFGERAGLVWRHNFALYAEALGREQQAAATVAEYEERVRRLNAALPNPRPSVSVIRVLENNLRAYQRANFIGILLTDLGFPRPPAQNVDDFGLINLSLETVDQYAPADLIAVSVYGGDGNPFGARVLESPLFRSLDAVKQGKTMIVNDRVWIAGLGYTAADSVFDDIAKHFGVQ